MTHKEAVNAIEKAGLALGDVEWIDTTSEKEAKIYYQSMSAGSKVNEGTSIDIELKRD